MQGDGYQGRAQESALRIMQQTEAEVDAILAEDAAFEPARLEQTREQIRAKLALHRETVALLLAP
jgi:hypothetical protein